MSFKHILVMSSFAALAACAVTNNPPTHHPTYDGSVTSTRLNSLYLEMENGTREPFSAVFQGYQPDRGLFTLTFPMRGRDFDIGLVHSRAYKELFRQYDANGNDFLDRPEMVVMYVQEAAIGLGKPVAHIGTNPRAGALLVPREDVGGLLRYINSNRGRLDPKAQALFRDMPWLAEDIRSAQEGGREKAD